MTTQKQIEANRQNAQQSTGPGDATKARLNAVKHGVAANLPLNKQEKEKLDGFLTRLREQFDVKTLIGEYLIARIAVGMLRLERVPEYEEYCQKQAELSREGNIKWKKRDNEMFGDLYKYYGIYDEVDGTEKKEYLSFKMSDDLLYRYETAAENKVYRALEKIGELKKSGFVL